MCDSNYEYFISEFDNLYKEYANKFVVIKDKSIIGNYDSFEEAYNKTIETEELGTFLIQLCSKNENNINFFYSNNVVFA